MTRLLLPAVAFTMLLAASSLVLLACGKRPDRADELTQATIASAELAPAPLTPTPGRPGAPVGLAKKEKPKYPIDPTRVSYPAAGEKTGADSSTDEERKALVEGNNAFALDLYRRLAEKDKTGNILFSPYSMRSALALAYAGARGETAEQMAKALRFTLPQERLHPAFAGLDRRLRAREKFHAANAVWAQHGLTLKPEFLRLAGAGHGAGVGRVDFRGDRENARWAINRWVAEQTHERIDELLKQGVLQSGTLLVLTNAVHFLADWETAFSKKDSRHGAFHTSKGWESKVLFMQRTGEIPYFAGDGVQAVELPYRGCDLSMVLMLPQSPGGFAEMERSLTGERLAKVIGGMKRRRIGVMLPAFEMREELSPFENLAEMGMIRAFGAGADFSGISDVKMWITDIVHEAWLKVDERGTEAAAATAVLMGRSGGSLVPWFSADRPFLLLIRDRNTGALLFVGRVMEPKSL